MDAGCAVECCWEQHVALDLRTAIVLSVKLAVLLLGRVVKLGLRRVKW